MIRNYEAVRFIADELKKLQRRLVMIKHNRNITAFHIDFLYSFSKPDDRRVAARISDYRKGRMQLPKPAIKNNEIWFRPVFSISISSLHHFRHGFEIICMSLRGYQFEFAILAFCGTSMLENSH